MEHAKAKVDAGFELMEKLGQLPHETDDRLLNLDPDWETRRNGSR